MKSFKFKLVSGFAGLALLVNSIGAAIPSFFPQIAHASSYTYNSTNQLNKDKQTPGRVGQNAPYVELIGADFSEITLQFNNPAPFVSCFEYRTDGDTSQVNGTNPSDYPNPEKYPRSCITNTTEQKTFTPSQYVEIRVALGPESDFFFDWTRFDIAYGVCTYDFQAEKMWEVTWGYGFEDRNGGAPLFTMSSNGGLVSLNNGPVPSYMTPSWHWLYITDSGNYNPRHYDYGFADGTTRTVDYAWTEVNGCHIPTSIVWNEIGPDTIKPTIAIHPDVPMLVSGTAEIDIEVTDDRPLDSTKNKQTWVEVYGRYDQTKKKGQKVDLSSGTGAFTFDSTTLPDGEYILRVGSVQDAAGNWSGDKSFRYITIDNTAPSGVATYTGGTEVAGVRYVSSIDNLSFTETVTDLSGVVRATFLVQKFNTATNKFEGFCGNWNASSTGSHALGGSTTEIYTENNVKVCKPDIAAWTDGTYKIFHAAYDAAGNEGKYNTNRQIFVIDSTPPVQPQMLGFYKNNDTSLPIIPCGGITNNTKILIDWEDGEADVAYYWFGTKANPHHKKVMVSEYKGNMTPGNNPYFYTAIAVDHAGNESVISDQCGLTLDQEAPDAFNLSPADGTFVNGSSITQAWGSNASDVDHFIYESYNDAGATSLRWHEEIVNTSKTAINVGEAEYWWRVKAVDHAGNEGSWSPLWKVTVDNTAPDAPAGLNYETALGVMLASGDSTNELTGLFDWDDVSGAAGYNLYVWHDTVGSPLYGVSQPSTPVNDTLFTTSEVPGDLSVLGESTQSVCITAVDAAGNESACSTPFSLTLDLTAPTVTLNALLPIEDGDPVSLSGNVDDPAANVTATIDGSTHDATNNGDGTWSLNWPETLAEGSYTVDINATDSAGNAGTATGSLAVEEEESSTGTLGATDEKTPTQPEDKDPKNQNDPESSRNEQSLSENNQQKVVVTARTATGSTQPNADSSAETGEEQTDGSEQSTLSQSVKGAASTNETAASASAANNSFDWWWLVVALIAALLIFLGYRSLAKEETEQ